MTLTGFELKLRRLNHNLHIYRGSDVTKPAGVWINIATYHGSEYEELCGIEKFNLKEWPTYSTTGKMITGGWHRVLYLLVAKGYIKLAASRHYFGPWDTHKELPQVFEQSAIDTALANLQPVRYRRIENPLCPGSYMETPVYKNDEVVDIGRMIHAQE